MVSDPAVSHLHKQTKRNEQNKKKQRDCICHGFKSKAKTGWRQIWAKSLVDLVLKKKNTKSCDLQLFKTKQTKKHVIFIFHFFLCVFLLEINTHAHYNPEKEQLHT